MGKSAIFAFRKRKTEKMEREKNKIEQVQPHYRRLEGVGLDVYTREEATENRLMRGRALLNSEKNEFIFAQNEPRGPRSKEVGRTYHSRFVRRPDGEYTVTLRFSADESDLRESLLAEVRTIVTAVKADRENERRKEGGK